MSRSMWKRTTTATVMMAMLSNMPMRFHPIVFWKNRATARSKLTIIPPVQRHPYPFGRPTPHSIEKRALPVPLAELALLGEYTAAAPKI
jgi:hypothetical protein